MAMKFTGRGIAALKPKSERYEVWENGRAGFGLRVTPKGKKSWVFCIASTESRARPSRIS